MKQYRVFRKGLIVGITVFFIGACVLPSIGRNLSRVDSENDIDLDKELGSNRIIIYVDDDNTEGPWNGTQTHQYQFIQDGVNAANSGDTVFVYSGTYNESVFISVSINLFGEDKNTTIVNAGGGATPSCFNLMAEWINISGFKAENSDNGGVDIRSNYCKVYDNNILNNRYGVVFRQISCYNLISGNNISSNSFGIYSFVTTISCNNNIISRNIIDGENRVGWGFYLTDCNNFTISDNVISSYRTPNAGLKISACSNFTIKDNIIKSNYYGVQIVICNDINVSGNSILNNTMGIYVSHPSPKGNILYGNNIVNNSAVGIVAFQTTNCTILGNTISNNSDNGIFIRESTDCTILSNTILNNIQGLKIMNAYHNNISGNTFSNNSRGIYITTGSSNNILLGNTIQNNELGIYLYHMYGSIDDNTITGNTIVYNEIGIKLRSSNNNIIYNNYFNNTNNTIDNGNNIWNITKTSGLNIIGGPFLGGNYWSDYIGLDLDNDGIGDTPYNISGGNNKDYLPLTYWQNIPPGKPTITGPTTGKPNIEYNFTFNSDDFDGDDVRFHIDWGDGDNETTSFVPSGTDLIVSHSWVDKGTYTIKVYAEDEFGLISIGTTFQIIIEKSKTMSNPLLNWLQNHPNMFPLLQTLIMRFGLQ
jgi:parallel beta-helix repeat protein